MNNFSSPPHFAEEPKAKRKAGKEFAISGARKKILSIREKRQKEDLMNALAMKKEMEKAKKK